MMRASAHFFTHCPLEDNNAQKLTMSTPQKRYLSPKLTPLDALLNKDDDDAAHCQHIVFTHYLEDDNAQKAYNERTSGGSCTYVRVWNSHAVPAVQRGAPSSTRIIQDITNFFYPPIPSCTRMDLWWMVWARDMDTNMKVAFWNNLWGM